MPSNGSKSTRSLLEDAALRLHSANSEVEALKEAVRSPIAIVGAGVRLPGGVHDLDALWSMFAEGRVALGRPQDRPGGERAGGFLTDLDRMDAAFFGLSPAEASRVDPQQRLLLEVAWEAIEDAGLPLETLQRADTGVYVGIYGMDYLLLQLESPDEVGAYTAPGVAHSIAANRISYQFDLKGPSVAVDTACSSSLVAVHLACQALRAGDCDIAIAAGVNAVLSPWSTTLAEKTLPFAHDGRCRPFDADTDGIVRAEACGAVVLERSRDATRKQRRVRAVVRGSAVNQDGRTNGITAPSPVAQRDVVERALRNASVDPDDVVYVEAHGTGTRLGDPIEVDALREIYGRGSRVCGLGSAKANIGHAEAAAGVVGLLKAMLVLERGQMPPQPQFQTLNPEIDLSGSKLAVPRALAGLPAGRGARLAAVSSFGFGGTNAHALLQEPAELARSQASERAPPDVLTLPISARDYAALSALVDAYERLLAESTATTAADLCAAAARNRTHHPKRLCVVGESAEELSRALRARRPTGRPTSANGRPRVAFVFTGQGTQWAGMGMDAYADEPVFRDEVVACDQEVRARAGWSIVEQLRMPPGSSRMHETEIAQLCVASLQLGLVAWLDSFGVTPDAVIGHSMGEIVAARAAGWVGRDEAIDLLLCRARAIEQAAHGGAMCNLDLPESDVRDVVAATPGRVSIAAVNGPRACVISGDEAAVESAAATATARGADPRRLRVEYGFHSPMLDDCEREVETTADRISPRPSPIAMYSTVTGGRAEASDLDARHWGRNLRREVRFASALQALLRDGPVACVEIGPRPTLLPHIRAALASRGNQVVTSALAHKKPAALGIRRCVADLYEAGCEVRWDTLVPRRNPVRLPAYPWQRQRHWLDREESASDEGDHLVDFRSGDAPTGGSRQFRTTAEIVRSLLADALCLDDPSVLSMDAALESFDIDSVVLVELRARLEAELQAPVTLRALIEAETLRDVVGLLDAASDGLPPSASSGQ